MTEDGKFDILWEYCTINDRFCPMPDAWNRLYGMLRNTVQKPTGGWEPPLPLILAAWHVSTPISKQLRFLNHLAWAEAQGQLDEIGEYLRSLEEREWCHFDED